jgi:2,3-bisphosphoglycerate-dependent phosphoglycerate mutase
VAIKLVFETHAMTLDNDQGHATGWLPGQLSERGFEQARQLGQRRAGDGIAAVFSSDLARATQTAIEAFAGREISVLYDWRLRECDYGQRNGMPVAELHAGRESTWTGPTLAGKAGGRPLPALAGFLTICHCAGRGSGYWSSVTSPPGGGWIISLAAFGWKT